MPESGPIRFGRRVQPLMPRLRLARQGHAVRPARLVRLHPPGWYRPQAGRQIELAPGHAAHLARARGRFAHRSAGCSGGCRAAGPRAWPRGAWAAYACLDQPGCVPDGRSSAPDWGRHGGRARWPGRGLARCGCAGARPSKFCSSRGGYPQHVRLPDVGECVGGQGAAPWPAARLRAGPGAPAKGTAAALAQPERGAGGLSLGGACDTCPRERRRPAWEVRRRRLVADGCGFDGLAGCRSARMRPEYPLSWEGGKPRMGARGRRFTRLAAGCLQVALVARKCAPNLQKGAPKCAPNLRGWGWIGVESCRQLRCLSQRENKKVRKSMDSSGLVRGAGGRNRTGTPCGGGF